MTVRGEAFACHLLGDWLPSGPKPFDHLAMVVLSLEPPAFAVWMGYSVKLAPTAPCLPWFWDPTAIQLGFFQVSDHLAFVNFAHVPNAHW